MVCEKYCAKMGNSVKCVLYCEIQIHLVFRRTLYMQSRYTNIPSISNTKIWPPGIRATVVATEFAALVSKV